MKIGLVLEGGAMRGMYTAGILDFFLKEQIHVDGVVGVSAGALFGVNLLSGQSGRAIRYNKRFNGDKNYMGVIPFIKEGNIINTKFAYTEVPYRLDPFDDDAFQASGIPFYAVVTNIETGKPEYIQIRSVFKQMHTLRASGSMPFVSRPVMVRGMKCLDGAICDSIPFEWFASQGYDKLIVVLTRDIDYRKGPMSPSLIKLCYHQYPAFAKRLQERHNMYNHSVELLREWEQEGKAFVIRPTTPISIGRMESDPERLQSVYDLGLADGQFYHASLEEYLKG